ncbi:MAG: hypothetical protein M3Z84_02625 [Actinomycetota bacterium]|nr:hypothetical protein [Actinomycetota bacterium]
MEARLLDFGRIEIEGQTYERDVVIDGGTIRPRKKGPSKKYRGSNGHTPLSTAESIPWGGRRLIVGTGANGELPIMPEVLEEAGRRGIELVAIPTREACRLIRDVDAPKVRAILHVTC